VFVVAEVSAPDDAIDGVVDAADSPIKEDAGVVESTEEAEASATEEEESSFIFECCCCDVMEDWL